MNSKPLEHYYTFYRVNGAPDFRLKSSTPTEYNYECLAVVPDNCLVVAVNVAGFYFDVYMMVLKPLPSYPGHRFLVRRIVSPIDFTLVKFPWVVMNDRLLNEVINKAKELGETEAAEHRRENPKPIYKPRAGSLV